VLRALDPLARARGYQRLLGAGVTVKGIAERLQTTQARVKEQLRILKLPELLQDRIAAGEVPLRAVKPLEALARIHPGLAVAAVSEVLDPVEGDDDAYSWGNLERSPLAVAIRAGKLPGDVYEAHAAHSIDRFELSEQARKDLAELQELLGGVPVVRFGAEEVEQARALGAAHGEHWETLIVGDEVANQLAGDCIARCLKTQRANERQQRKLDPEHAGDERPSSGQQDREDARRAEREAERAAREQATAFNCELGRAIYSTLSRVKVDERTLKLLASVDVCGELGELAMRGARYGFPGWIGESAQRNGKTKLVYIDQRSDVERRAREYLAGASTAGEIGGRQIALVAMAAFADQNAVAASNRSWHRLKRSGPWADEFDRLLDELVCDKLPDAALAILEPELAQRKQDRERLTAERRERGQALERLDGAEARIGGLTADELVEVERDVDVAWSGWDPRRSELRRLVVARRDELGGETG